MAKSRSYRQRDLKLLFARSAGYCAFPDCRTRCIADATELDREAIFGNIAHIVAHRDRGPRCDPSFPKQRRNTYENLIFLCANHHGVADPQDATYTIHDLRTWKADLEVWVANRLRSAMPSVGFAELQVVCDALLGAPASEVADLSLTAPREKMNRNRLTDRSQFLLTIGMAKAKEVQRFVDGVAALDPGFPEHLKAGFTQEYHRLVDQGQESDDLFDLLVEFASRGAVELKQQAAGVAVLAYLFEKCEVFEK